MKVVAMEARNRLGEDVVAACPAGAGSPVLEAAGLPARRPSRFDRLLAADRAVLLAFRRWHGPWRTRLALALTRAGDGGGWTAMALALVSTGTREGMRLGLRLGLAALLATFASQALKRGLTRARPTRAIEGFRALARDPDAFSFPSGHTAAAFAVTVALAGAPHGLGPAALVLAGGIGLSRVYLGAHYPLDVAAGAALGAAVGLLPRLVLP
jgi:undecaprenyl-diphosphatase